jgi:phospholipid/cholesterol/gamma-HCH transport system ATP-binding protein
VIRVENLCKSFNGRQVLFGIDLDVREGETLAIIGRSGSGKSVLLKHLIGLLKPDEGRVLVDGEDLAQVSYRELRRIRQGFGMLFQGGALFDSETVAENVAFPLEMFTRMTPAQVAERVDVCLDLVLLGEARDKKPSEISGGMQKRAALARAIALEPRYILYDEPTSGLDPQTSDTVNEVITRLSDRLGITSVVVTHDMHAVLAVADRIAFVHEGALSWTGTPADLHRATDETLLAFVRASEYQIGRPDVTSSPT